MKSDHVNKVRKDSKKVVQFFRSGGGLGMQNDIDNLCNK